MKRIGAFLPLALTLLLAACGGQTPTPAPPEQPPVTEPTPPEQPTPPEGGVPYAGEWLVTFTSSQNSSDTFTYALNITRPTTSEGLRKGGVGLAIACQSNTTCDYESGAATEGFGFIADVFLDDGTAPLSVSVLDENPELFYYAIDTDNAVGEDAQGRQVIEGLGAWESSPGEYTNGLVTAVRVGGARTLQPGPSAPPEEPEAPVINSFTANPATIEVGESTTLSWDVTGANSYRLSPGIGLVSGLTSYTVSPTETTTYTLSAVNTENDAGPVTATVTVTVTADEPPEDPDPPTDPEPPPDEPEPPVINSFTASSGTIEPGDNIRLSWNVDRADTLRVSPGVGTVSGSSVIVEPDETTTYTLTATNDDGRDEASVRVVVEEPDPPPPDDPDPPEEPAPNDKLQFLQTVAYGDDERGYIIGTIRNNTSTPMEFVRIVATLYNGSGDFLGTDFTYTDLDILLPGEVSPFKMILLDNASFQSYDLQVEGRGTGERPARPDVKSLRLSTSGSYTSVSGQVENTTGTSLEFVKIVFMCYRGGELVDTDFTYSELDTLSPGQTSPFEGYLISAYRTPNECEAIAQGRSLR